jgi:hypothetical protein
VAAGRLALRRAWWKLRPENSLGEFGHATLIVALAAALEGHIHSFRQIFLDRKEHLKVSGLWCGDSIGHWEIDTLVRKTSSHVR